MNRLSEAEARVAACLREHVSEVVASRMGDKVYRDAFCACGWELPWDLDKREEALTDHRAEVIAAVLGSDAHTEQKGTGEVTCAGCGATAPAGTEGWRGTDAPWCPKCAWLA